MVTITPQILINLTYQMTFKILSATCLEVSANTFGLPVFIHLMLGSYSVQPDGTLSLTLGDGRLRVSAADLLQYLATSDANDADDYDDEDVDPDDFIDDEDEDGDIYNFRHYSRFPYKPTPVRKPILKGLELLMSGEFGRVGHQLSSRQRDKLNSPDENTEDSDNDYATAASRPYNYNFAQTILNRGSRIRPPHMEDVANEMIPTSNGTVVARYSANAYVGQYSSGMSSF